MEIKTAMLTLRLMMRAFSIALLFALSLTASAQVNVSGDVYGTWGETELEYWVVDDIRVPGGQFLTILPGVTVAFMSNYDFLVEGGLTVSGTETDSVRFVFLYGTMAGAWAGIEFNDIFPGMTSLDYCVIESGERAMNVIDCGLSVSNSSFRVFTESPVRGDNASITMDHCIITNSGGSGFSLSETTLELVECEISHHTGVYGRGINSNEDGSISMLGGYIGQNSGEGISGLNLQSVILTRVEIANNGSYGINLTNCTELEASYLAVHHNEDHGIFTTFTPLDAHNLTISSNAGYGITCASTTMQVSSSIVDRNDYGGFQLQSGLSVLTYNCAFNDAGNYFNCSGSTGSIEEDPLYISTTLPDYSLTQDSPCIDTGSPFDPLDPDGTQADMGAYFYDQDPVAPWQDPPLANNLEILQTFPNPFNPVLNIAIQAQAPVWGVLDAWTIAGSRVAQIWEGRIFPGQSLLSWDASALPSGIYILKLDTGGRIITQTCCLAK